MKAIFLEEEDMKGKLTSLIGCNVQTITNLPIKIDRVLNHISADVTIGVSGTFRLNGVKFRGVWDANGELVNFEKPFLFSLNERTINKSLKGVSADMFRIVKSIEL
jgi:hypothetical protein